MHFLDLARVLGKIGLVFATVDYIFVVRPPNFLIREEFVAGLLLLSLDLLLQASRDISEPLFADTIGAAQPMTRNRAI